MRRHPYAYLCSPAHFYQQSGVIFDVVLVSMGEITYSYEPAHLTSWRGGESDELMSILGL